MPGVIARIPRLYFVDLAGAPLIGGTVEVYEAGTTTPKNTWQNRDLTVLNTNPIELDGRGSCVIWLQEGQSYKIVVRNRSEVIQWTQDNIEGGGVDTSVELGAASIQAALDEAAASAAAALSYLQAAQLFVAGQFEHLQIHDYLASNTATIPGMSAVTKVFFGALLADPSQYTVNPVADTVTFAAGMPGIRKIYIYWI